MRKTKFRAWDKQRKQMLFDADYWSGENREKGNSSICYPILVTNHGVQWCKKYPTHVPMPEGALEFDRMTMEDLELNEYTGLKDKSGVEIYEGDLLKWVDWREEPTDKPDIYRVDWLGREARFSLNCFRDGRQLDPKEDMLRLDDEFEVIGNIFENPELLEATS